MANQLNFVKSDKLLLNTDNSKQWNKTELSAPIGIVEEAGKYIAKPFTAGTEFIGLLASRYIPFQEVYVEPLTVGNVYTVRVDGGCNLGDLLSPVEDGNFGVDANGILKVVKNVDGKVYEAVAIAKSNGGGQGITYTAGNGIKIAGNRISIDENVVATEIETQVKIDTEKKERTDADADLQKEKLDKVIPTLTDGEAYKVGQIAFKVSGGVSRLVRVSRNIANYNNQTDTNTIPLIDSSNLSDYPLIRNFIAGATVKANTYVFNNGNVYQAMADVRGATENDLNDNNKFNVIYSSKETKLEGLITKETTEREAEDTKINNKIDGLKKIYAYANGLEIKQNDLILHANKIYIANKDMTLDTWDVDEPNLTLTDSDTISCVNYEADITINKGQLVIYNKGLYLCDETIDKTTTWDADKDKMISQQVTVDLNDYYTKTEANALLDNKENLLTAGDDINIDKVGGNVIKVVSDAKATVNSIPKRDAEGQLKSKMPAVLENDTVINNEKLTAEVNKLNTKDTELEKQINQVETDYKQADAGLEAKITANTNNLTKEIQDRKNTDTTLQNNINTEKTERQAEDSKILMSIGDLTQLKTNAKNTIVDAINELFDNLGGDTIDTMTYNGYWNVDTAGENLEIVKMSIQDNKLHQSVCNMNGSEIWNSDYEFKKNSTYDNPLECIADSGVGGGPRADYKIYWDGVEKIWIWLWFNQFKRYICRTEDEAKQKVAENI